MDIFRKNKSKTKKTKINNIISMNIDIVCSCGNQYIVTEKEGGTRCHNCKKDVDIGICIM